MSQTVSMLHERPILFSPTMVRAVLTGTKTQTRRLMKPQPTPVAYPERARCPYGQAGHRLWARETFYIDDLSYRTGPLPSTKPDALDMANVYYRADGDCCAQISECQCASVGKPKWKPAIHMPRWASRLTLEVTSVRIERVQQITDADALAEGVQGPGPGVVLPGPFDAGRGGQLGYSVCGLGTFPTARMAFAWLWDSIHAKVEHPWTRNEWVWRLAFRKLTS